MRGPHAVGALALFAAVLGTGCVVIPPQIPVTAPPPPTSRSVWDGVYTPDQAARGQATYLATCTPCHLEDMTGKDMAPALAGIGFKFRWRDRNLADLLVSLRLMPQDNPGTLTDDAYVDLIAFLLGANDYPAGPAPLSVDEAALAEVRIVREPR